MKVVYNSKEIGDNYNNYNRWVNKPLINSVELVGNITLNDINVYTKDEVKKLISSARSVKTAINLPSPLTPNTTYYIGPNEHNIYTVYLTDSSDPINAFVIGTTSFGKYYSGEGINVTDDTNIVSVLVDSESVIINSEGLLEAKPVFEKMVPFVGATASKDGSKGLVPKPEAGDQDKFLMGDCTWKSGSEIAKVMWPVGSIYISYSSSYNPNILFPGTTWELLDSDHTLQTDSVGGAKVAAGLPNVKGDLNYPEDGTYGPHLLIGNTTGSDIDGFRLVKAGEYGSWNGSSNTPYNKFQLNLRYSSTVYTDNFNSVRPNSITVCIWRRTA